MTSKYLSIFPFNLTHVCFKMQHVLKCYLRKGSDHLSLCLFDENLYILFPGTTKPINWPKPVYDLDQNDQYNNGFLNQDFLVWMRCAALPNFRKLYGRITGGNYAAGLPAGNYTLAINYSILLLAAVITPSPSSASVCRSVYSLKFVYNGLYLITFFVEFQPF